MRNLSNQIFYVKGKRVDFNSLPFRIQEKLLKSFKDDRTKDATETEGTRSSENEKLTGHTEKRKTTSKRKTV